MNPIFVGIIPQSVIVPEPITIFLIEDRDTKELFLDGCLKKTHGGFDLFLSLSKTEDWFGFEFPILGDDDSLDALEALGIIYAEELN